MIRLTYGECHGLRPGKEATIQAGIASVLRILDIEARGDGLKYMSQLQYPPRTRIGQVERGFPCGYRGTYTMVLGRGLTRRPEFGKIRLW